MFPRTLLAALLALALPATASAATYTVAPGERIQAAVDKANDDDTVQIQQGVYVEQVGVPDRITIEAAPGTVLAGPTEGSGPALSLAKGGKVTGLVVVGFVGDALTTGPGDTLVQRSALITVAKDAAALSTTAASASAARTVTLDSTILVGARSLAASTASPAAVTPGKITVAARHVTAIGEVLADAATASATSAGIAVTFTDSIVRGRRTARPGVTPVGPAPATIAADTARNSVADDASDAAAIFVAPDRFDYHLRADASAVTDKGQVTGGESTTDIDGQPRTNGSASDYGADEFVDRAPTVTLGAPGTVRQGHAATFEAQAADPDGAIGGGIVRYVWSFGDGSAPVETTSPSVSHTFAERREHAVTVTVTDRNGSSATSSPATFTVLDGTPPTLTLAQPGDRQRLPLYTAKGKRRKVVFFGTARDDTALASVQFALRRTATKAGTCRWFDGRRLKAASCSAPIVLTAKLVGESWRYVLPRAARPPRGVYQVSFLARDASGLSSDVPTHTFRFR